MLYSFLLQWFNKLEKGRILTVRDLLSWIQFIMVTTDGLGPDCAFLHGLFLVLLDGISLGNSCSLNFNCIFSFVIQAVGLLCVKMVPSFVCQLHFLFLGLVRRFIVLKFIFFHFIFRKGTR